MSDTARFSFSGGLKERLVFYYFSFIRTVFLFMILFALYNVFSGINQNRLIFESFKVPSSLEVKGYSGAEIAKRISDEVRRIRDSVKDVKLYSKLDTDEQDKILEFEVPGAGISLSTVTQYLRIFFGKPVRRVYGSVVEPNYFPDNAVLKESEEESSSKQLHMMVRISGFPSKMLSHNKGDVEQLIARASEYILLNLEPISLGLYYRSKKDKAALKKMLADMVSATTERDKQSIHIVNSFIYSVQKKYPEALKAAKRAMDFNPENGYALHNYSMALYDVGDRESALEVMDQLSMLAPHWSTYNNMAYLLMELGRYDEALDKIDQGFQDYARCTQCYDTLSEILFNKGDYPAAINSVETAMELSTPDQFAYYYDFLARIYLKMGEQKQAIQAYQNVISSDTEGALATQAAQKMLALTVDAVTSE